MLSFIKICLICIIGKNRLKEKFHRKARNISRLTYILGFSVNFFFQPIYTDYTNWTYILIKDHI
jgi:hypothetical protein